MYTHLNRIVSANKILQFVIKYTNNRCDICNVDPRSVAKLGAFILLNFSFCIIASKCRNIQARSVRLHEGNWPIKLIIRSGLRYWLTDTTISSNWPDRSVVRIGSGNSLQGNLFLNFQIVLNYQLVWFTLKIVSIDYMPLKFQNHQTILIPCCCKAFLVVVALFSPHQLCKFVHWLNQIPEDNQYNHVRQAVN